MCAKWTMAFIVFISPAATVTCIPDQGDDTVKVRMQMKSFKTLGLIAIVNPVDHDSGCE